MLDGRAENHGPDGGTSGFTADQQYFYDGRNRLDTAEEKISSTETWKQTFTFDRYGNRRIDAANTTAPANCTSAICNPTFSTATNRISSSGYAYDADGNLTQNAAGERFGYDQENRQKEFYVNGNNGTTPDATYSYDGEGRRVKKISSTETTIFVYDGASRLVAEYSTALAETQQVSYLTTDHLGSPRLITNQNGAVTKRQDFAAFGDETLTAQRAGGLGYTSTDELRQDYTGYQKDNESGLEYAQARYYNTAHGRFTSVDPLTASATIRDPQSFNRYSYVLNSPYKFTDPLGLLPLTSAGACGSWCANSYSGPGGGGAIDSIVWGGFSLFCGWCVNVDSWALRIPGTVLAWGSSATATTNLLLSDPKIRLSKIEVFVNGNPHTGDAPDSTVNIADYETEEKRTIDIPSFRGNKTILIRATFVVDGDGEMLAESNVSGVEVRNLSRVESLGVTTPEGPGAPSGRRWDLVDTVLLGKDSKGNLRNQVFDIGGDGKSATLTFAVELLAPDFKKNNPFVITVYGQSNRIFGPNGALNVPRNLKETVTLLFTVKQNAIPGVRQPKPEKKFNF